MLPGLQSKPPAKLGRFEVGAKIGGGGMATIYLGRDLHEDGTEQLVALKVMKDELAHRHSHRNLARGTVDRDRHDQGHG